MFLTTVKLSDVLDLNGLKQKILENVAKTSGIDTSKAEIQIMPEQDWTRGYCPEDLYIRITVDPVVLLADVIKRSNKGKQDDTE